MEMSAGGSWQTPGANRLSQLLQAEHVGGQRLAISELSGSVAAFGVKKIQQGGGASFVGVGADVARIFGLLEVAGGIKLYHFLVCRRGFIGIDHVSHYRIRRSFFRELSLCTREAGAGDFTLIAVKDRNGNAGEPGKRTQARSVRIIGGESHILLSVGFGKVDLALGCIDALPGSAYVRALFNGF